MQINLKTEAKSATLVGIREILTEENTDEIIRRITAKVKLPFWLRWIPLGTILDKILPGTLLSLFEDILDGDEG